MYKKPKKQANKQGNKQANKQTNKKNKAKKKHIAMTYGKNFLYTFLGSPIQFQRKKLLTYSYTVKT